MPLEFIVTTDLALVTPKKIETNYVAIRSALTKNLEKYRSIIVTQHTFRDGKNQRAQVNRVEKGLAAERARIKEIYMRPYIEFETQCKDLEHLCAETSKTIDVQIKAFEEAEKIEKERQIKSKYGELTIGMRLVPTFEKLLDPKWLNKGTSMDKANEELGKKIEDFQNAVNAIIALESDYEASLLHKLMETLSLADAITLEKELKSTASRTGSYSAGTGSSEIYTLDIRFHVTASQAALLRDFCEKKNICYESLGRTSTDEEG